MRSLRRATKLAVVVALVALVGVSVAARAAEAAREPPTARLDRAKVHPGEAVLVSTSGIRTKMFTLSVCGNLARRGSMDCNMQSSQSDGRDDFHDVTVTQFFVQAPPVPCPCVIRVSDANHTEVAVAAIEIIGHPVAPVVGLPNGPLVVVAVDARRASSGLLGTVRTALGGRTRYVVTVSVENRTSETLERIRVTGSARHRFDNEAATLSLPAPGPIAPGQTWTREVEADISAPLFGRYVWEVTAAGAGSAVSATHRTDAVPVLLLALGAAFLVDVSFMARRLVRRRRQRRRAEPEAVTGPFGSGAGAARVLT